MRKSVLVSAARRTEAKLRNQSTAQEAARSCKQAMSSEQPANVCLLHAEEVGIFLFWLRICSDVEDCRTTTERYARSCEAFGNCELIFLSPLSSCENCFHTFIICCSIWQIHHHHSHFTFALCKLPEHYGWWAVIDVGCSTQSTQLYCLCSGKEHSLQHPFSLLKCPQLPFSNLLRPYIQLCQLVHQSTCKVQLNFFWR